jgi:hypothetical protein
LNFAEHCIAIEHHKCGCGYEGHAYMFVTINGKTTCVRCAGCKEPADDRAQAKRAAAKRGAEKLQLRNSRASWE